MAKAGPSIALPTHEFFYTTDQVALILNVEEAWVRERIYLAGRMPDLHRRDKLLAVNLAGAAERPRWRISNRELTRWLIRKGYRIQ
jgi:hypothetical protein